MDAGGCMARQQGFLWIEARRGGSCWIGQGSTSIGGPGGGNLDEVQSLRINHLGVGTLPLVLFVGR